MSRTLPTLVAASILLTGCGSNPATPGSGVSIRFRAASSAAPAVRADGGIAYSVASNIGLEGTNGTLTIDDVRFIVSTFELDLAGGVCNGPVGEEGECEEVPEPPTFVALPLDGTSDPVVRRDVPAGQYVWLKFEIQNLQDDGDDEEGVTPTPSLIDQIRNEFADWPGQASMLVTGSFTPTGGTPVPFRVYFDAEIEIEKAFDPPLVIDEMATDKSVTVTVDPRAWFLRSNGTVMDLSQYDFDATGQLLDFQFEIEEGFTSVHIDDD